MLKDSEINELLAERKPLPANALTKLGDPQKVVSRSKRATVSSRSDGGKRFSILASLGPGTKFSIHVRYHPTGRRKPITLIRCNCPHAPHRNVLEKTTIPAGVFHIHTLTERYQRSAPPRKALMFAVPTSKYHSFESAVEHVCYSYGFYFKAHQYKERFPLFPDPSP